MPGGKPDNLTALDPGLPILAFLAATTDDAVKRETIERAIASCYRDAEQLDVALKKLRDDGLVSASKSERYRLSPSGQAKVDDIFGSLAGKSWLEIAARMLTALTLGIDPKATKARAHLARKDNLESAILGRLFDVTPPGAMPSRTQVRFALLRAFITARMPECEPVLRELPMQNTSRDVISRAVMLGAAGLTTGTVRDAETAMLRKTLGLTSDTKEELVEALIRASLGKNAPRLPARIRVEVTSKAQDLTEFATTVRDLAKTLKTAPFAGRVAIAQVYDAGISRGLDFGSLDEFKSKVASACRAGLLDLERYDIAGPMDSALRERSRTAFGRDERHFIVNEWI